MVKSTIIYGFILIVLAIVAGGYFIVRRSRPSSVENLTQAKPVINQNQTTDSSPPSHKISNPSLPSVKTIRAADVQSVNKAFTFSAQIPTDWQIEAVTASESINIYNPNETGENNLEKSQIFIRYFSADRFLTLPTVNILERQELTINNRPAVHYLIEKKSGVTNFPNQPAWRNVKHIVTDIRVSDSSPSIFYVIAGRPKLAGEIYESFLESLEVIAKGSSLLPPVREFRNRITKKPFGILIDPKTSPVQPERFAGYHTGVDAEYEDVSEEVPVVAIADGTVVRSVTAPGYGGVLVIRHSIADEEKLVVYGHLDPKSLSKNGSTVKAGEQVGVLGEGGTSETDGERKHLHLAILRGQTIDLKGYVNQKEELANWADPILLFP